MQCQMSVYGVDRIIGVPATNYIQNRRGGNVSVDVATNEWTTKGGRRGGKRGPYVRVNDRV